MHHRETHSPALPTAVNMRVSVDLVNIMFAKMPDTDIWPARTSFVTSFQRFGLGTSATPNLGFYSFHHL
jgi:hypothetical protein